MLESNSLYEKKIIPEVCPICGTVYSISLNEHKHDESIKKYVLENSSVMEFSSWNGYYDFNCAGIETLKAYSRDCNRHKQQVKDFLDKYSEEELIKIRDAEGRESENNYNLANKILNKLGYEFMED